MNVDPLMTSTFSSKELERVAIPTRNPGDMNLRLDQAWRVLNLNQDLIRSADQKIYLLIVMSTLLVSYVAANIDKISRIGPLQFGLLAVFILASGTFYFFALSTLFARKNDFTADANVGLIFFGDIARRIKPEDFVEELSNITMTQLFEDLARQIYLVSNIATNKYKAYSRAWRAILVEVSLFIVLAMSMVLARG
ncbi:MAG: Pycsar system effector family protein [Betaproteobacteria bacterium]